MSTIDNMLSMLRKEGPVILLESQFGEHPESRKSYLAGRPSTLIRCSDNHISVVCKGKKKTFRENPWTFLSDFVSSNRSWLFGYFGYDLKNSLEELQSDNEDRIGAPDLFFMIPENILEFDQKGNLQKVIKGTVPEEHVSTLEESGININIGIGPLKSSMSKEEYISMIKKAQHGIREGSFYEVNLSRRLTADFRGDAYQLYRKMRSVGPVPFGAFLCFDEYSVCSLSPERFLKREKDTVFSQPIKGTIKRGKDAGEDRILKGELSHSDKDRSENLMIVDLVRNDLSRIARPGSVKVSGLFEIQTFGTIHQMVSTVSAKTAVDNPIEIIRACYPMGSMTGAPKIRAMKTIEELENYKRGIYSGAIGYITPERDFDFNVVIRTAVINNETLFYSVGGAITGDSRPEQEWEETKVKARALTKVVE